VRVILPNRVSTMFSQEPCVGVSTYLNRLGRVAERLGSHSRYGRNGCRGSVESCTPADGEYPGPWAA
jgi:hypothetical protein